MANHIEFEEVRVLRKSGKAVLLDLDGEEHWVPIGQIEDNGDDLSEGETIPRLYLTEWICMERGLL